MLGPLPVKIKDAHKCMNIDTWKRFGGIKAKGSGNIDGLVSKFGDTDPPTWAPTEPVLQVLNEEKKMSMNFGYWQS
jgi:hypothetical protein